ncbi:uncharacterized protein LOC123300688 [Chrysoperla carnea]|uniref:uncharacterized protein LOC123300688 n=1 Tax=Chrysoperla carnea TaxID=189513 RepID=UPI001D07753E|nr:uncharacterized protein LOC123300688 [Chrysoperla carnea]
MNGLLMTSLFTFGVLLWTTTTFTSALSCDSCGQECAAACGSRHFRACCFNYLRKRNGGGAPIDDNSDDRNDRPLLPQQYVIPGLRLELWPAKLISSQHIVQQIPYYAELSRTSRDILHHQQAQPMKVSSTALTAKNTKIMDNEENLPENLNNSLNNNEKTFYDEA